MKTTGNTILITGATSGIGRAFAERFAELGNKVLACGRRGERLRELKLKHPGVVVRVCDVSKPREREELVAWALREHPELNVLVNNAGIQLAADLTRPVDLDNVELEVETNLVAPIHLASLAAGHLARRPASAIINISSGLAFTPIASMSIYCATKAAVHSLSLSLRHQLRKTSVRVFEIAPPGVDTELGFQHREDPSRSHGGMPIDEFLSGAMKAIEGDVYEAAIGPAEGMHEKREELFARMNGDR